MPPIVELNRDLWIEDIGQIYAGWWGHRADSDLHESARAAHERRILKLKVPRSNCVVAVQAADTVCKGDLESQRKDLEQDLLLHMGCRIHLRQCMWLMSMVVQSWGTIHHTVRSEVLRS